MRAVITIGSDRSLFVEGSKVRARTLSYGKVFSELHIVVFSLRSHGFVPSRLADNVWLYPTSSRSRWFYIVDALRLGKRIAAERRFDASSLCISAQDPFESGLCAYRLARLLKAKLHLQVHTDLFSPYFIRDSILNVVRVFLAKFLLPKADGVRVVSKRIAESFAGKGVRLRRPPVVLPIFVEIGNTKETVTRDKNTVLVMSRFSPEKDIFTAIDAFALARKQLPSAFLLLVGEGIEQKRLMRHAEATLPKDSFKFLGWQNDPSPLFSHATVFLNTSKYEGYGLSLIESALGGCPIVTTDVGIASELIPNEFSFCLTPQGATRDLGQALVRLLSDAALSDTYAHILSGRAKTLSTGSFDSYIQAYRDSVDYCFL